MSTAYTLTCQGQVSNTQCISRLMNRVGALARQQDSNAHATCGRFHVLVYKQYLHCLHLFLHQMPGQPVHSTRPPAKLPPSFLDMDACTTSQLKVVLVRKLLCAWLIFFNVIHKCLHDHWQTSGQLVQELNVCTIP